MARKNLYKRRVVSLLLVLNRDGEALQDHVQGLNDSHESEHDIVNR